MPSNSNRFIRLDRAYRVDEAINTEEKHLVIVRFGHESDEACKKVDEWLAYEAETFKDEARVYTVAMNSVPELVARYNLSAPSTILFFANNNLVHYLSGDQINQGKIRGTVDMLMQKKKIGTDAISVTSAPTPSAASASPDVNHSETTDSHRTPSGPRCNWFWWNKQY